MPEKAVFAALHQSAAGPEQRCAAPQHCIRLLGSCGRECQSWPHPTFASPAATWRATGKRAAAAQPADL